MMTNWQVLFPAGVVFAMVGGVIGVLGASESGHTRLRRVVSEAAIAAVWSASFAEFRLPLENVWVCGGAGVGVGLITGYTLDAVKALAPKFLGEILSGDWFRKFIVDLASKYTKPPK